MLGIILKDYYESFCIKKNLWGMIFGFGSIVILSLVLQNFYNFCLIVGIVFPLIGASPLQYAMEQDEISKFDDSLLTFPLTKREIVGAQFIACLSFCGITSLLAFAETLLFVFVHKCTDFKTGLMIWAIGIIFSITFLAIITIGFFALGNKKGTIIYIAIVIIIALGYAISYWNFDFSWIFKLNTGILLLIALSASLLLLAGSYKLCLMIYIKKHS